MKLQLILYLVFLVSCKREIVNPGSGHGDRNETGFVEYVIVKGGHYADKSTNIAVRTTAIRFSVRFDSSAIYTTTDPFNQGDINKLYGFSDCEAQHHISSARFGWNWINLSLHLYAYCYVDSLRIEKDLGIIDIGKEYPCSIAIQSDNYIFSLNNETHTMRRSCNSDESDGYKLFPYFGGDETAPHDVHLFIRDDK